MRSIRLSDSCPFVLSRCNRLWSMDSLFVFVRLRRKGRDEVLLEGVSIFDSGIVF